MPLVPLPISRWAAGRNEWKSSRKSCDAHRPLAPFFGSPFSDTWFSCSTQQDAVGCVWTWFVDSSTTSQDTRATLSATTSLVFDASSAVSASDVSATASDEPSGTTSTSSLYATATTTTTPDNDNQVDDGDDDDDCEDETLPSIPSTTSHDPLLRLPPLFPYLVRKKLPKLATGFGLATKVKQRNGLATVQVPLR